MSDDEKLLHYQEIQRIVKEEVKPINRNINIFISVAIGIFGFMFYMQVIVTKDVQAKANTTDVQRDYLQKLEYYQVEEDEHNMMLGLFSDQKTANFIFGRINDNIKSQLGFKFTTRGENK